jgi:hypothetical protein
MGRQATHGGVRRRREDCRGVAMSRQMRPMAPHPRRDPVVGTPLIVGQTQKAMLLALREEAAENPIDMPALITRIKTPDGKAAHMRQMNSQTVEIPLAYLATFSIEVGHPVGTCRHMSLSSRLRGRTPTPEAVWMIAEELGFAGGLAACKVWPEDLQRDDHRAVAINVLQPVAVTADRSA